MWKDRRKGVEKKRGERRRKQKEGRIEGRETSKSTHKTLTIMYIRTYSIVWYGSQKTSR